MAEIFIDSGRAFHSFGGMPLKASAKGGENNMNNLKRFLIGTTAGAAILARVVLPVAADSSVVITGNTSPGENQPGWMFNRDVTTATPYEFNTDAPSIGIGSLYVLPIGANASDKFIAENFVNSPIANVNSISYDFKIGSGGDANDDDHFYMNVYANFGVSADDKFYDCRYNIVPTSGSTASFTTVTFDPSLAYPVTQSGSSPFACPSTPNDMDTSSPNSTIRVFAINVGDTSTNDVGLDGYLDNVVVSLDDSSGVTTFDFEPIVRNAEITSPTPGENVSGMVNFVAHLTDDDVDPIQWAVREGTCAAGTNTVFGNVDGKTDAATIDTSNLAMQTFAFTGDMSAMTPGMYCFIYNPAEDGGEAGIRETVEFNLVAPTPDPFAVPAQCSANGITYGAPIIGTEGSDIVNGTNGNDLIFALGGSDIVNGKNGHDCIVGGDGSDVLRGGNGNDIILGGAGSDSISGDNGNDSIYGEEGDDSLSGGRGIDMIDGGEGSDSLTGGNGADTLMGGPGSDSANGGAGNDTCIAEAKTFCEA